MAEFKRDIGKLISDLKGELLFSQCLRPDILKGDVFFAIRNGYASFYHKGSSLFTYGKNGKRFATNAKFGFVPETGARAYVTEDDIKNMPVERDFIKGYIHIKERAERYATEEAKGVSELYHFAPGVEQEYRKKKRRGERFFLVDIEIAFAAIEKEDESDENQKNKKTDRIDILLYDNKARKLLFCEAKHYSNGEIWAEKGKKPKVITQLKAYRDQIKSKDEIMAQYATVFEQYAQVMGIEKLSTPIDVHDECLLLVFGYDTYQEGKIKDLIIGDDSLVGHDYKFIGKTTSINENTLVEMYSKLEKKASQ